MIIIIIAIVILIVVGQKIMELTLDCAKRLSQIIAVWPCRLCRKCISW